MIKTEFLERISAIGTCDNDVERRELLSQLSEEVSRDYDNIETLTETNRTLTTDNETLRDANMKLFLRVGESKSPEERKKDETGISNKNEKLKFEDLFDEKGGIK